MAKIIIKSLPQKYQADDTDILITEDTATHKITVGDFLAGKQDKLTVNPENPTEGLNGLTIDGVDYAIAGGGGGVVDVLVDGTSVLGTDKKARVVLTGKQNVIADLDDIRSGASAGATAVQPAQIKNVERTTNRVNTITASSDDNHYPTAKAVWDLFDSITNLDEVAF